MIRCFYCLVLLFFCVLEGRPYHTRKRITLKKKQDRVQSIKRKKNFRWRNKINIMQMRVEGIECDLCAQTVVNIIAKHGGQEVRVHDIANDYEHCYLTFVWPEKNKNIAIAQVKSEFEKEGFDFLSLNGSFYGTYKENDDQLTLRLNDSAIIAKINQNKANNIKRDRLMAVNGMLSVAADQYNFELI